MRRRIIPSAEMNLSIIAKLKLQVALHNDFQPNDLIRENEKVRSTALIQPTRQSRFRRSLLLFFNFWFYYLLGNRLVN